MNTPEMFTNKQLLDELYKRFQQDADNMMKEELKRLESEIRYLSRKLQESEKGKSQFLSNVRNEINNPLTSIMGLAGTIHGLSSEEKVKRMSFLIHQQAFELDFQMRNVIRAAEIEMGEVKATPSRVNIVSVLEEAVGYFKEKIEQLGVMVKLDLPDHLRFTTDTHILNSILLNLVSNGINFCGPNKVVVLTADEKNGELEIVVRDFGTGIDNETRKVLFERFKQGQTGFCKQHAGHGLGLSIVSELVGILNGSIDIQSSREMGTAVHIVLPSLAATTDDMSFSDFGNEFLFTTAAEF